MDPAGYYLSRLLIRGIHMTRVFVEVEYVTYKMQSRLLPISAVLPSDTLLFYILDVSPSYQAIFSAVNTKLLV